MVERDADDRDVIDSDAAIRWGGDAALVEMHFTDDRIGGPVPIERLTRLFDPFAEPPWYDGQDVTREGVTRALKSGRRETTPYSAERFGKDWDAERHEARIAWLVENKASDPIHIEFSEPTYSAVSIEDGHHRLAAAIYRGDTEIMIELGGFFAYCVETLGVICRQFQRLDEPHDDGAAVEREERDVKA